MRSFAPRARTARWAAVAASVALSCSSSARADDDGVYGRFDGDLSLRVDAGAAFARGGPAFDAAISALYLDSAGVYAHYTDAFGSPAPMVVRSISTGIHVQPLFIARWASDAERGPAHLDLTLDSLAFEIGALWDRVRDQPMSSTAGLEIALGFALPILPRASGPLIGVRGALRWRDVDLRGDGTGGAIDRGALLSLTLGFRQVLPVHAIDAGDRAIR